MKHLPRDWNRLYVAVLAGVSGDVSFRTVDGYGEPEHLGEGVVTVGVGWLQRNEIPASDLD